MCAGYDERRWRAQALAEHLCRWIPEWSLRYGEWDQLSSATMVEMVRRAALKVYTTERYESRGEFGELMLHAIIRWEFETEPAISKIYFKDRANDAVKGFDCVHVSIGTDGKLDLWLGEAKFYVRRGEAISAVAAELREHLDRDYLREEFAFVLDKIDPSLPWADEIRELLDEQRPLDEIVSRVRIPVLLAYDSAIVRGHNEVCPEYESALETEAEATRKALLEKVKLNPLPRDVVIELILLPVDDKKQLTRLLDQELRNWQGRA
jgi:HamA